MLPPNWMLAGTRVSCTLTVKLPLVALPAASVAEQSTVVVVMANVLPEAGVQFTVTLLSTTSLAVAVKLTTLPLGPAASKAMLAGRLSVGAVVSTTLTVKLSIAVLPAASVAEQSTWPCPERRCHRSP